MSKQSPYETPESERVVRMVFAEYARRFIATVVIGAFLLGGWLTKLQLDVNRALPDPELPKQVAQHEWMIQDHEKRITRTEARQ